MKTKTELIPFEAEDGAIFMVEVEDNSRTTRSGRGNEPEEKAPKRFEKALAPLKSVAGLVMNKIREIKDSPEEVTLEMGVKLTAEAGAVLTKAGGEAHFKLTIKWKNEEKTDKPA